MKLPLMAGPREVTMAPGRKTMTEIADFNGMTVGSAPKGWTLTMTGRGAPKWTVEKDDAA